MRALLGTEFAALLARAAVPPWACSCRTASPAAIQILLEEVHFSWHETLGVPPNADAGTIRRAWARLAHAHHPDKGGTQEQKGRLNAAYQRAGQP
jgi:DnaJ-domain-containing protein 1